MKIYYFIRLAVLTALAVLIGVFSHHLLEHLLQYLVGGVMILFGVENLLFSFLEKKKGAFFEYQFYLGGADLLLGLIVITAVPAFEQICIVWATWTIVRESLDIFEAVHKAKQGFPAVLSFALSVVEIVFSILLLLSATGEHAHHHALTHVYLLIPEFVICGLAPLAFLLYKEWIEKKNKDKEVA